MRQQATVALLAAVCVTLSVAAPQFQSSTPIPILRSAANTDFNGGYSFSFETGNEITREEIGELRNVGTPDEAVAVRGSYSYRDPEGNPIVVTYTADENGFIAEGAHLPVPPPIPDAILEALAKNAAEEARLSDQDRAAVETGRYVLQ